MGAILVSLHPCAHLRAHTLNDFFCQYEKSLGSSHTYTQGNAEIVWLHAMSCGEIKEQRWRASAAQSVGTTTRKVCLDEYAGGRLLDTVTLCRQAERDCLREESKSEVGREKLGLSGGQRYSICGRKHVNKHLCIQRLVPIRSSCTYIDDYSYS